LVGISEAINIYKESVFLSASSCVPGGAPTPLCTFGIKVNQKSLPLLLPATCENMKKFWIKQHRIMAKLVKTICKRVYFNV
jgi:hypothetical protein